MAHYRRCLEQASFESHDSLVDRVGFKRRAKSASWAGRCRGRQKHNRDASVTDAPPIGVNVSPWRCCFNDNAVDYDDCRHRGWSTGTASTAASTAPWCQPFASRTRRPASRRNRAGVALRFNRTGSNKDEKCGPRPADRSTFRSVRRALLPNRHDIECASWWTPLRS